tara:strand:- start:236 stop:988 length:753 start_codon:yes stop_codon:yes gene_type:complete
MDIKIFYILFLIISIYLLYKCNCIKLNTLDNIEKFSNFETQTNNIINDVNSEVTLLNENLNKNFPSVDDNYQNHSNKFADDFNKFLQENQKFELNDPRISKLQTEVSELGRIINNIDESEYDSDKFKTVKSQNNGLELGLINIGPNKFLVKANNGCLGINQHGYDIYKCNPNNKSQHFRLNKIFNELNYSNNVKNYLLVDDKNKIEYPFTMIQSISNDNCIANNQNNIRVMPCNMLNSQRWNGFNRETCS